MCWYSTTVGTTALPWRFARSTTNAVTTTYIPASATTMPASAPTALAYAVNIGNECAYASLVVRLVAVLKV